MPVTIFFTLIDVFDLLSRTRVFYFLSTALVEKMNKRKTTKNIYVLTAVSSITSSHFQKRKSSTKLTPAVNYLGQTPTHPPRPNSGGYPPQPPRVT